MEDVPLTHTAQPKLHLSYGSIVAFAQGLRSHCFLITLAKHLVQPFLGNNCYYTLNRFYRHQLRMQTCVTEHSRKMDDSRQRAYVARLPEVLVPDDRLADRLGLRYLCVRRLQKVKCDDITGKLEREACGTHVRGRGANVVEHSGEEESFSDVVECWKILDCHCLA